MKKICSHITFESIKSFCTKKLLVTQFIIGSKLLSGPFHEKKKLPSRCIPIGVVKLDHYFKSQNQQAIISATSSRFESYARY